MCPLGIWVFVFSESKPIVMKLLTGGTLVNNPMCEQAWVGFTSGAMKVGLLDMWEWCLLRVVRSSRAIGGDTDRQCQVWIW